jgi:hypothetical protein
MRANNAHGQRREREWFKKLQERYPADQGYVIIRQAVLRDMNRVPIKDPVTKQKRHIDFVVGKRDGRKGFAGTIIASYEVTSHGADKDAQVAQKEANIRTSAVTVATGKRGRDVFFMPKKCITKVKGIE